jgi:hypothetical protein
MLKSIKKKDSLELIINSEQPDNLTIKIIPVENNRVTVSNIKIQEMQNIEIDLPEGYEKPNTISSSEYQKMCKDMNSINKVMEISSTKNYIRFKADMTSIYSRDVIFGEEDDEEPCVQTFDTEQLLRISKIAGLNKTIQVYMKEDLPMLFKANIGNIGKISIYIKSKEQNEKEMVSNCD